MTDLALRSAPLVSQAAPREPRLPAALHGDADLARWRLVSHGRAARSRPDAHRLGDARVADAALPDAPDLLRHTARGTRRRQGRPAQADDPRRRAADRRLSSAAPRPHPRDAALPVPRRGAGSPRAGLT